MRVAFFNPIGEVGGGEMSLLDLMAALPAAMPGIERHLIVAGEGPLIERARSLGVTVHHRPLPKRLASLGDSGLRGRGKLGAALRLAAAGIPASLALRGYAGSLRTTLREIAPDVIHSNGIKAHLLLRLARPDPIPVVWHVRDFPGARPVISRALSWASASAAHAVAISEAVGADVRSLLPRLPVTVVYNAIDIEAFSPAPGDPARLDTLAGRAPAAEGTMRIGLLATYARWKGQDLFLEAVARLPRDMAIRAYLIGGPIYKTSGSQFEVSELKSLADRLGIGDRVAFVPFQCDTAWVYRSLDLVVHASTQPEPFGRTIVEAMACGKPVVVSRAGGAAELFIEDVDAVGFELGSAESLAAAIQSLARDPARRARLGRAARDSAVRRFARERLGHEVADVYRRVLSSRP